MEQATADADAVAGSPPETSGESQASNAHETQQTAGGEASQGVPPSSDSTVDRDAEALARLDKGESVQAVRQTLKPVTPSAKQASKSGNGAAESKVEPEKGDAPPDAGSLYEGLDAKAEDTLRRAGLLTIDPQDWKQLSQKGRQAQLAAAKRILSEKGRVGQQLGQARKAAAAPDPNDFTGDNPALDEEAQEGQSADGTAADEPRYTQAEWQAMNQRGARAQTQPPARAEAQTPDLQSALKPVRDVLGEEFAGPLEQILTAQQQALAQLQQQNVQQQTVHQQQLEAVNRQIFMPEEREAFKTLAAEAGDIPAGKQADIKDRALAYLKASAQAGHPIEWRDAIETIGRAILTPVIRQTAQQDLLKRRDNSLRATPSKAASTPHVARVMTQDEKDAAAIGMLDQGRSVAEVRSAFSS